MLERVKVCKYGQTVPSTKASGLITGLQAKVNLLTWMEISMTGTGRTTRQMATESTYTVMGLDTKATGKTITNKDMAIKSGLTAVLMMGTINKEKRMVRVLIRGRTEAITRGTG